MQSLSEFAATAGFTVPHFELDGQIHRFDRRGKQNAWYVGWQHFGSRSGEPFTVAVIGDWKTGDRVEFKTAGKHSKEDNEIIKRKMQEAQRLAEEQRRSLQAAAKEKAARLISESKPVVKGEYLSRKQLTKLYGAGTILDDSGRTVVVPMRGIDGELRGAQRIMESGDKRFITGQDNRGAFHVIGSLDDPLLYICEGFATGATVHEATGKTVVVAFNAGNLEHVARDLRKKYTATTIIIAGDDDAETDGNPGRTRAEAAAAVAGGTAVYPVFKNRAPGQTDFNDLALAEGLGAVAAQLERADEDPYGYLPLGHDGATHYFFVMKTKTIKAIRQFSEVELYSLMPLTFWELNYPGKTRVSWSEAKNDLVQRSEAAGIFDASRIRGTGVWWDAGRVVINNGQGLVLDGTPATHVDGYYRYITTANRTPKLSGPLSIAECRVITDACAHFKWRDEKSWLLLAGHLAIARISGALKIRPHCWITGGSESGKSTVMLKCVSPCLGDKKGWLQAQGATTEAGLRQTIGCSSLPVVFDEFESNGGYTAERIAGTLELFRSSWAANDGVVIKGSAGGAATAYQLAFPAIVASIRVPLLNDADRSRFCVLELAPHGNDVEHYRRLEKLLDALNIDIGERLFARSCAMVKTIRASHEVFSRVLARVVSQRYGQQVGAVMAGWHSLVSDSVVSEGSATSIIAEWDLAHEKDETTETDDVECLNHLLTWKVSMRMGSGAPTDLTIGQAITMPGFREALLTYGVKVNDDHTYIVANKHAELSKIYASTQWARNWSRSLARSTGAKNTVANSFGSRSDKCRGVMLRSTVLPVLPGG
jgi:putative DNA primase/helicase